MVIRLKVLPFAVAVAVATGVLLSAHVILHSRVSAKAFAAGDAQRGKRWRYRRGRCRLRLRSGTRQNLTPAFTCFTN